MIIKVCITDDHPLAIAGLQNMLLPFPHIKVNSTYETGEALLEGLSRIKPDIILLDLLLPDINGKELAKIVLQQYPDVKIIALTSLDAPTHIKTMMRQGCKGYLLKNTRQTSLVKAIETVFEGGEYIEPSLKERMLDNIMSLKKKQDFVQPDKKIVLTRREKEILQLVVQEYNNQEIAEKLFLSIRTIENHKYKLHQKLETQNAMGLLKTAIELGLL
jgi:DNA-binding NarL/FixJ family response regulator